MSGDDLEIYKRGFDAGWNAHETQRRVRLEQEAREARQRQHGLLEKLRRQVGEVGGVIPAADKFWDEMDQEMEKIHHLARKQNDENSTQGIPKNPILSRLKQRPHSHKFSYEEFPDMTGEELSRWPGNSEEDMSKQPTPQEPKPGETPPDKMEKPYGG